MDLPEINQRIRQLVDKYTNRSVAKFAETIEIPQQTLNRLFNVDKRTGKYPLATTDMLVAIARKYPEIDTGWLLSGERNMLISEEKGKIPVYDVESIGGHNDIVANVGSSGHITEWIDAGDWFPEATAAIHHYGDSMVEYPSGCILALKRVNDPTLILNGRNYVIETEDFRVTKQLQDDGNDYIIAYSTNKETYPDGHLIHSPIRIPKASIRHIDLVLGCVTKEYSNGAIPIVKG